MTSPLEVLILSLYCDFVGATSDFANATVLIEPGYNCTYISTIDDEIYERSKLFTVTIASRDTLITNRAVMNSNVLYHTVILQDNEG